MKNSPAIAGFHAEAAPHAKRMDKQDDFCIDETAHADLADIVAAQAVANDAFQGQVASHADWAMIHLLLNQDEAGKPVVTKHITEICGRSAGTVRNMLRRFEIQGFVARDERIGRSELYRPTDRLRRAVNDWSASLPPRHDTSVRKH